jgi:hypothetical protein
MIHQHCDAELLHRITGKRIGDEKQ